MFPVVWFPAERHDSEDPDVVGALDVDDTVGEFAGEVPAGGLADEAEGAGRRAGIGNQAINHLVEAMGECRADLGI